MNNRDVGINIKAFTFTFPQFCVTTLIQDFIHVFSDCRLNPFKFVYTMPYFSISHDITYLPFIIFAYFMYNVTPFALIVSTLYENVTC